jgi:hypothetical protein
MGLLGLNPSVHDIYATDGSLAGGRMGAGVYIVKSGMALRCRVGRRSESRTSLRLETGASYLSLEHGKDIGAPISQADLLARLRFSTYTLTENKIRPLTDHELQITVSAFLDLRPDD